MKKIKELLKSKTPEEIMTDYLEGKILLTQRELQKIIELKETGRGSSYKWRGK